MLNKRGRRVFQVKRQPRLFLLKALDSLVLSVEHFNRPSDRGRVATTLILLDHGFEMLLKAGIVHRGGRIWMPGEKQSIGFDKCVRCALSDGNIRFLSEDQALTLQMVNGLRDAAQHFLLDVAEQQLYIHAQSGLTLFRDILRDVFDQDLRQHMPARVLPISISVPADIITLFDSQVAEVVQLLAPGRRRTAEAYAKLRPLVILDETIRGSTKQPSDRDLEKRARHLATGKRWQDVFPGAAVIVFHEDGDGPNLNLRLGKREGVPVQTVPEGTNGASVVAVKRVNDLDFYNLGCDLLAKKVGLTRNQTLIMVWHLDLRNDEEYYKEFEIGSVRHKRYSQKCIKAIRDGLAQSQIDELSKAYHARNRREQT